MVLLAMLLLSAGCVQNVADEQPVPFGGSGGGGGPQPFWIADTGQTNCYHGAGSWSILDTTCTAGVYLPGDATYPFGQDAHYDGYPGLPRTFTGPTTVSGYPSDYIAIDNLSGAYWSYCPLGLSGATCATGTESTMNHSTALTACNTLSAVTFAGRTDWRLPRADELMSILDHMAVSNPATVPELFSTGTFLYWSSTTNPNNSSLAYTYDGTLNGQSTLTGVTVNTVRVRCISDPNPHVPQYVNNGDDTVTETVHGLRWQRCALGAVNDATCSGTATGYTTWADAMNACESLSLAGITTWRLPNLNELTSLIDYTSSGLINATYFPGSVSASGGFWSSTTWGTNAGRAWYVYMVDGQTSGQLKSTGNHAARCVTGDPVF